GSYYLQRLHSWPHRSFYAVSSRMRVPAAAHQMASRDFADSTRQNMRGLTRRVSEARSRDIRREGEARRQSVHHARIWRLHAVPAARPDYLLLALSALPRPWLMKATPSSISTGTSVVFEVRFKCMI